MESVSRTSAVVDRPHILLVDDEEHVVQSTALVLRQQYQTVAFTDPREALGKLDATPLGAAILDYQMPGMDGLELARNLRQRDPDVGLVLLTGHADLSLAIEALNSGLLDRFVTKPSGRDELRRVVSAAVELGRLRRAERELLDDTLRGCMRALVEMLSFTMPEASGRALRRRGMVRALSHLVPAEEGWALELAALLRDVQQTSEELLERVLAPIPRTERVRFYLREVRRTPGCTGAQILRAVAETDRRYSRPEDIDAALAGLRRKQIEAGVVEALRPVLLARLSDARIVPIMGLSPGMVLSQELRTQEGELVLADGVEMTVALINRLQHWNRGALVDEVRVRG